MQTQRRQVQVDPLVEGLYTVDLVDVEGRSSCKVAALGVPMVEAQRIRDRIAYRHPDWDLAIKPLVGSIQS